MAHDDAHAGILRAAGIQSMIIAPLTSWGRTFGALTFATAESGRYYSPAHLRLAQTVGSRVAMAIDNARLFLRDQGPLRRGTRFWQWCPTI